MWPFIIKKLKGEKKVNSYINNSERDKETPSSCDYYSRIWRIKCAEHLAGNNEEWWIVAYFTEYSKKQLSDIMFKHSILANKFKELRLMLDRVRKYRELIEEKQDFNFIQVDI